MSYKDQIKKIKDFLNQYEFGIVICDNLQNEVMNSLIANIRDDLYFSRFLINPSIEKLEKIAQIMRTGEVAVLITNNFTSGFKNILNSKDIKGLILCSKQDIPERVAHLIIPLEV